MDAERSTEVTEPRGLGAFRILRRLPASSREVYLASAADGARVVLKVFDAPPRNQGLLDPKIAEEASAYARLSHPNIVRVLDMFSADGKFVIALEHVEGCSLAVLRASLERAGKTAPDECWIYVMHGVFSALAEAHAARDDDRKPAPVLHRGVNPSNVLLGNDGSVKLGNFNVAHSVRVLRDSNPGFTWGSYGYFAPEQVKLQPPGPYTDVYSATLMLWELLAGRKGIVRASLPDAELLKAMASPSLTPLERIRSDLAAPVRYAVHAGLDPDPKRRVIGAARIRDVLAAAMDASAARAKLVELVATVEAPLTSEPPSAAPKTPSVIEITSILPDPEPEAPPLPPLPRPAPAPVFALSPLAPPPPAPARSPEPAKPPPPEPAVVMTRPPEPTKPPPPEPAVVIAPPPEPAPAPVASPFAAPVASPFAATVALTAPALSPPPEPKPAALVDTAPPFAALGAPSATTTPAGLALEVGGPAPVLPVLTPVRRRSTVRLFALSVIGGLLVGAIALLALTLLHRRSREHAASAPTAPVTVTHSVAAPPPPTTVQPPPPAPPPSETAAQPPPPPPTATAAASSASPDLGLPPGHGRIVLPERARGHRVYIDRNFAGDGTKPLVVKCGHHALRIGKHAKKERLDVPCGGEITVD
jgi:serine/threonine protein kinase